jgi:hypothetical protein
LDSLALFCASDYANEAVGASTGVVFASSLTGFASAVAFAV